MILLRIFVFCWLAASVAVGEDVHGFLRKLREFQAGPNAQAVDFAWPYLDSPDGALREAARIAIQRQPFGQWKDRALEEKGTWASLELLRALIESCPREQTGGLLPHVCEQITTLRLEQMETAQLRASIGLTRLVFAGRGPVTEDERQQMIDLWSHLPPPSDAVLLMEWRGLLDFLRAVRPKGD